MIEEVRVEGVGKVALNVGCDRETVVVKAVAKAEEEGVKWGV